MSSSRRHRFADRFPRPCPSPPLPAQTEISSIREHVARLKNAIEKIPKGNAKLESTVRALSSARLATAESVAIGSRKAAGFAELTLGPNPGVFLRVKALFVFARQLRPPISLAAVDSTGALGFVTTPALTMALAESVIEANPRQAKRGAGGYVIILDPELRALASDDADGRVVNSAAADEASAFLIDGVALRTEDTMAAGAQIKSGAK